MAEHQGRFHQPPKPEKLGSPRHAEIVDARQKGQVPISAGTSLALEGFVGIMEDKPPVSPIPYSQYDDLWINLRTMYRNMFGSMERKNAELLTAVDFAQALIEEMHIVNEWIPQVTGGRFSAKNVHFYLCTYKHLSKSFPYAKFKKPETDLQKLYAGMENNSMSAVMEILGEKNSLVSVYDVTITGNRGRTIMLTHFPIDLINMTNVQMLALLESNTGVVKGKGKWYTKLKNGASLPRIPFDRMTVQMFGDNAGMFLPLDKKERDKLIELSEKYKWNAVSTKDRILQCVKLANEPIMQGNLLKLYT